MFDNRWRLQIGRLHLGFALGSKRIAYAYIRKNGCSAFKKSLGFDPNVSVNAVARAHPYRPWRRYDTAIFVWRDPEERLLSLYRSKVLEARDAEDIRARYRKAMGAEPDTFENFARFATMNADPHCRPQRDHLMPIRYTHAIPLARLHETMREIVGDDAAQPFAERVNTSAPKPIEVSDEARHLIRQHYARDYTMIRELTEDQFIVHDAAASGV